MHSYVDIVVNADLSKSAKSDNLNDTVDYVHLYHIVYQQFHYKDIFYVYSMGQKNETILYFSNINHYRAINNIAF